MVEEQGIRTIEELEGEAEEELRKNPFLYECFYCQRAMTSLNKILAHVGVNKNHSGKNKRNLRVDCSVRRVEEGISSASIPPEDYTYPKRYPYCLCCLSIVYDINLHTEISKLYNAGTDTVVTDFHSMNKPLYQADILNNGAAQCFNEIREFCDQFNEK